MTDKETPDGRKLRFEAGMLEFVKMQQHIDELQARNTALLERARDIAIEELLRQEAAE